MVVPEVYDRDVVHRLPVDAAVGQRGWWLAGRFENETVPTVELECELTIAVVLERMRSPGGQRSHIGGGTKIIEPRTKFARRGITQPAYHEPPLLTGLAKPFIPEPYDQPVFQSFLFTKMVNHLPALFQWRPHSVAGGLGAEY
jgi:hypothetical protein